MRLKKNIYLVGAGAFGISHSFDCSVYIIDCVTELVMIDTGAGCEIERIIKNIEGDDLDPQKIKHILLTHSHADHAGGAHEFSKRYGAKIYISEIEADAASISDERILKLDIAKRSGFYSPNYQYQPCKPSVLLKDNDRIDVNGFILKALHIPGHSEGSICYQLDIAEGRALFTGDVSFYDGAIGLLNCNGSNLSDYRNNIGRLGNLDVDMLLPGHFVFVLSEGQKHIDKAIKAFSLLEVPKNFI